MSAPDEIPESCWRCGKTLALTSTLPQPERNRTLYNFRCNACGHLKTKIVKSPEKE